MSKRACFKCQLAKPDDPKIIDKGDGGGRGGGGGGGKPGWKCSCGC